MIFVTAVTAGIVTFFSLYAYVLVPVVLPAKERPKLNPTDEFDTFQDHELLKILFPYEDSWVYGKTQKVSFSNGTGVILFKESEILKESENLDYSQLRVSPCVVLFFPDNREEISLEERYRQAVVLEAENYALLEFDGSFGFSRQPQLKGGQLNGIVRIRSDGKNPDPSDNIQLVTSDVLFNFNQIRTSQRVDFKFGPNSGYGHDLTIQLANTDESKKGAMPNTITRIDLRELGELRLYFEDGAWNPSAGLTPRRHVTAYPQAAFQDNTFQLQPTSPGSATGASPEFSSTTSGTSSSTTSGTSSPSPARSSAAASGMSEVHVFCKGLVNLVGDPDVAGQWLLTFRNQVDVLRVNPQGASDRLNCQELILTLGPKEDAQPPISDNNPLANFGSLSPLRVRALGTAGSPVTVRSPENKGFQATGRDMLLDLVRKELSLTQGDGVAVSYDRFEIKGKSLYYAYGGDHGIGKLDMPKGGVLEGTIGTDASKRFKLEWEDELKVLPDKNDPNLTQILITGKPKAEIAGMGTAAGNEMIIWCDTSKKTLSGNGPASTIASDDENINIDIKKILVRKNVILKTDNGEISTNDLEIGFQPSDRTAQAARSTSRYPGPQAGNSTIRQTTPSRTNASGGSLSQLSFFGKNNDGNKSSYTVRADKVDVLAVVADNEMIVDQILLTKNVKLDEIMSVPGQGNMNISGQTVHINKPDTEQMTVRIEGNSAVSGGHAVFQGRGILLMGGNINVDSAKNEFWVEGRGQLRISQQTVNSANARGENGSFNKLFASSGNTNSANQAVIVDWAGGMKFDGQELLFVKDVDMNYSMMAINKSDSVAVYLTKPFRFFENDNTNNIEPERVVIHGNIELERDTFAENNGGQLTHERVRLTAVEIFPISGAFKGLGPGYVSAIFAYNGDSTNSPLSSVTPSLRGTPTDTNAAETPGLFGKGLKFMQCNFNGSVEGNYNTKQIAFHDRVVTMICPAQSFRDPINTNNPRNIVANGMLLECNKLEITQPQQGIGGNPIDLKAEGNVRIEMTYDNRYYIANADKIKFEQGKNLLTMESNQYSEVELYEGANLHAPTQRRAHGRRIYLNPVTNEVQFHDFSTQMRFP